MPTNRLTGGEHEPINKLGTPGVSPAAHSGTNADYSPVNLANERRIISPTNPTLNNPQEGKPGIQPTGEQIRPTFTSITHARLAFQPPFNPQLLRGMADQSPQPEQIEPLELEGLVQASFSESWGGNAGPYRATVNANYRDGRFIYGDDRDFHIREPSISFRIRTIPYELEIALKEKGIIRPPSLIDKVEVEPGVGQPEEFFRQKALQHNAFKILGYLQRGGNPDYLPKTPFFPDINELQQRVRQQ